MLPGPTVPPPPARNPGPGRVPGCGPGRLPWRRLPRTAEEGGGWGQRPWAALVVTAGGWAAWLADGPDASALAPAAARHAASVALTTSIRLTSPPLAGSGWRSGREPGRLWQALDDLDELVAAVAVLAGQHQQFPRLGEHRAALRGASHGDAAAAAELQQPL